MSILRSKKENPFAQIDRALLQDSNVSFGARGLAVYVLSLPNDWKLSIEDLSNRSPQGKAAIRSMMHELMKSGYVVRKRVVAAKGRFDGYSYTFHEQPVLASERTPFSKKELTVVHFPDDGLPDDGKPHTNVEDSSSKEEHVQSDVKEDFDRVWNLYGKKKDKAKSFTAYKNLTKKERAACEAALPAYVKSTPDVQYRKLLSSYIHGKRWEDDLTEGEQPAIQDEAPTVQLSEQWEASYQRFANATGEAMADRAKMVKPLTREQYVAWSTHTRRPLTGRLHKNNLHGKLLNWLKTNTGKMSTYKLQREIITMDALLFHTYTEILKESGRYGEFSESVAA